MIFVKNNMRFHARFFFGQIMFDEHLVRKEALLDYKILIHINTIMDFLKELTHDFGQNLKFPLCFCFGQNGP